VDFVDVIRHHGWVETEYELAELAARQGGVITRTQLLRLGFTDGRIRRCVQAGRWQRVINGVYRLFPSGEHLDVLRAAIAALPDAVVSHRSAATLHGLTATGSMPTVSVHSQTTHVFPGVTIVRCHDLLESHIQANQGLPITNVARTLMDLAARTPQALHSRLVDDAIARRLVTPTELNVVLNEVARQGKPGVTSMRETLSRMVATPIAPSVMEARFQRLLVENGIRDIEIEYPIPWAPTQRFDVAFPDRKLAIELDSRRWHTQVEAFDRDRARDREAVIHGWRILRFTWSDVVGDPSSVLLTIHTALRQ
jgi:very-short-patch-repair endonuclease